MSENKPKAKRNNKNEDVVYIPVWNKEKGEIVETPFYTVTKLARMHNCSESSISAKYKGFNIPFHNFLGKLFIMDDPRFDNVPGGIKKGELSKEKAGQLEELTQIINRIDVNLNAVINSNIVAMWRSIQLIEKKLNSLIYLMPMSLDERRKKLEQMKSLMAEDSSSSIDQKEGNSKEGYKSVPQYLDSPPRPHQS